jgi:DNA polymerase-3 subunit epsilon
MDFVAIDFETANEKRNSPCAIAIVIVSKGEPTAQHSWLIRPKDGYFNPFNTRIHGITAKDVADKPEFNELWETLRPVDGGSKWRRGAAEFGGAVLVKVSERRECVSREKSESVCPRV